MEYGQDTRTNILALGETVMGSLLAGSHPDLHFKLDLEKKESETKGITLPRSQGFGALLKAALTVGKSFPDAKALSSPDMKAWQPLCPLHGHSVPGASLVHPDGAEKCPGS